MLIDSDSDSEMGVGRELGNSLSLSECDGGAVPHGNSMEPAIK